MTTPPEDDAAKSSEPPSPVVSADKQSPDQPLPEETAMPHPSGVPQSEGWDTTNSIWPVLEEAPSPNPAPQHDTPLFQSFIQPEVRPPVRMPHLGHLAMLGAFAVFGLFGASALIFSALHFRWLGVTTQQQAAEEIHYTLGSELVLYGLMFGACLIFFPLLWHKGFFAGIQWNGAIALKLRNKLFVIASICCALALANGLLLPGPKDAPIEKIFRSPGAAWLLFAFGVTIAPFFEELIFRGFLLPALCTGADWIAEKLSINSVPGFDPNGRPLWPAWAIRTAVAVYASIPLAVSGLIIYRHKWITVLAIFIYCLALLGFLLTLAFRRNPANMNPQFGSLDPTGHPLWSMPAMLIGSILTSLPFAAMHAAQTGYSWGPFVLLVGVSLVLCWARLSTRSLAASVFVHASYNFLLFTLMMLGTSGFRHMDKM